MFKSKSKIENELEEKKAELERIEKECVSAKKELAEFKHKKKMEEEDIKHMRKMEKEALEQKMLKYEMEQERAKDKAVAKVKDDYRDKLEARLQTEVVNIKEMYGEILQRLPNINVKMGGKVE